MSERWKNWLGEWSVYVLFLAGMLVSNIGRSVYFICMTWFMFSWTGSLRSVTLMLLISTSAQFLSSGITGLLTDITDKRLMAIILDLSRALIVALTGYSIMAGTGVVALYFSIAAFAIADRGYFVAMQSMIPWLTGKEMAVSANAASYLMMQTGTFTGAVLSTFLLDVQAHGLTLSLIGVFFCLSATAIYVMGIPKSFQVINRKQEWRWRQFISIEPLNDYRLVVPTLCYGLIFGVGIFINTLLAAYVLKSMSGDANMFGKMEAAWTLGAALVCLILCGRCSITSRSYSFPVCLLMSGAGLVVLWLFPTRLLAAVVLIALGGIYNLSRIWIDARVQQTVEIAAIGRVKGAINMVATGLGLVIYVLIGFSSDKLSPSGILANWGVFIAAIGGFLLIDEKRRGGVGSGRD